MNESSYNTTPSESLNQCDPAQSNVLLVFTLIPLFQIIINIIVIVAVIHSRKKLRHNFVYVYVINTSMANLMFGLFSFYEMLNIPLAFERNWHSTEPFKANNEAWLGWWAFRTGMIVSLFIAMSGSILALIYGIRESSYFVGRTTQHRVVEPSKRNQRYKMLAIIFLNWFIPVVLCIASAAGWSCVCYCRCTPTFYSTVFFPCEGPPGICSTIMLPQINSFMLTSIIIWLLQCVGIVVMIVTTIKKYIQVMESNKKTLQSKPSSAKINDQGLEMDRNTSTDVLCSTSSIAGMKDCQEVADWFERSSKVENGQVISNGSEISNSEKTSNIENISEEDSSHNCMKMPPMNHNIKLLLLISILFIVCTLPVMLVSTIDIFSEEYILNFYGVMTSFVICLLYSCIAPLVLVGYMAGLKSAVIHMLFGCSFCTKTTVITSSNGSH